MKETSYVNGLVSVVIPTYNQSQFIHESISSVIAQSYTHIEIIIADDCSTDGTLEICEELAKKDNRIRLLSTDKNLGIPANFNRAFDAVKGEFVAFLGGDDMMFPSKIERQIKLLTSDRHIGLVYSDMEIFDTTSNTVMYLKSDKGVYPQPLNWALKVDWYLEKKDTGIIPSACFARSEYYLKARYDNRFYLKHELLFTLEDYYQNPEMKWVYMDEVLGRYRYHESNFSTSSKAAKSIVSETFLVADICYGKYTASRTRIKKHLKYYTYLNFLFFPEHAHEFPRFIEIYKTYTWNEKIHLRLSKFFQKIKLLNVYLKFAKALSIV